MPACEVCGSDYDKAFEVIVAGHAHVYDSFKRAGESTLRDRA